MATVEVARETIAKRLAEAISKRDANAIAALHAPSAVNYFPGSPEAIQGREAIRKFNETMSKAFQDTEMKFSNIIPKGDTVAVEFIFKGKNTGQLELPSGTILPATNRQVTLPGALFLRVNDEGLIAEQRIYFDNASFLQQLGVKPPS